MNKYQVSISFYMDEEFMTLVPRHRQIINNLINAQVIDTYAISAEAGKGWITMNGHSKEEITERLKKSPIYRYWEIEIDELFVYDSQMYRFPKMVLN